jgi:hypothetical protein
MLPRVTAPEAHWNAWICQRNELEKHLKMLERPASINANDLRAMLDQ